MLASLYSTEIKNLECSEFRDKLKRKKMSRLIDVSTNKEHQDLYIPGSLNIDVLSPDFISKVGNLDKLKTYFVYSRSGKRGETASKIMMELGFKRVYNLVSGIESWKGTLARDY